MTMIYLYYPIPRAQACEHDLTVGELASALYPNVTVDCALPQSWVDHWAARDLDVRGCFVWGYPDREDGTADPAAPLGGIPLPLIADQWEWMLSMIDPEAPGVERSALHWLKLRRARD